MAEQVGSSLPASLERRRIEIAQDLRSGQNVTINFSTQEIADLVSLIIGPKHPEKMEAFYDVASQLVRVTAKECDSLGSTSQKGMKAGIHNVDIVLSNKPGSMPESLFATVNNVQGGIFSFTGLARWMIDGDKINGVIDQQLGKILGVKLQGSSYSIGPLGLLPEKDQYRFQFGLTAVLRPKPTSRR